VVGLPDATWGERVHAVVVPHAGAAPDEADLAAWPPEMIMLLLRSTRWM
jgi:acyl-CoA synthetase (AMP-forming)/AMP-acid ligase II